MSRTTNLLCLAALLFSACAAPPEPDDELAGESPLDGEDGKADAAAAFTFFSVTPHLGPCHVGEACSGLYASRPNRTTTACSAGVTKTRCPIDKLDWTGTALPTAVATAYEVRIRHGAPILLRATLGTAGGESVLRIKEVWVGGSDTGLEDGVFALVKDNGKRCARAPCPSFDELRLNSSRFTTISGVDFEPSGAAEEALDRADEALFGAGVIVVGERTTTATGGRNRTANQFYTRVLSE